jgi:hypothetical protein
MTVAIAPAPLDTSAQAFRIELAQKRWDSLDEQGREALFLLAYAYYLRRAAEDDGFA